ncbi:MAG TPA: hypothetical protein VHM90_01640 [Phycisphaerae bacterium]|jgi:hypothetical protein|nr:hypothetical protein [Phycisphaerae bacterium]
MTRWIIVAGLVVLNGMLAVGAYQRLAEPKAHAQIGVGARADIAAVAGPANGATAIYMLDVNSGKLVALRLDVANNRLDRVAQRNVGQDLAQVRQ